MSPAKSVQETTIDDACRLAGIMNSKLSKSEVKKLSEKPRTPETVLTPASSVKGINGPVPGRSPETDSSNCTGAANAASPARDRYAAAAAQGRNGAITTGPSLA